MTSERTKSPAEAMSSPRSVHTSDIGYPPAAFMARRLAVTCASTPWMGIAASFDAAAEVVLGRARRRKGGAAVLGRGGD